MLVAGMPAAAEPDAPPESAARPAVVSPDLTASRGRIGHRGHIGPGAPATVRLVVRPLETERMDPDQLADWEHEPR